jgi:hypothetical protein
MSVSLVYAATLTTQETLESNVPAAPSATKVITHSAFNKSGTLNATSTIPATKCVYNDFAMTDGALTLNLASILGTNGLAQVGTGLKPQMVLFENVEGNSPIAITEGASNGHATLGASFLVTLKAKQWIVAYLADAADDIDSSNRTWDVTGTGTQSIRVAVIMG